MPFNYHTPTAEAASLCHVCWRQNFWLIGCVQKQLGLSLPVTCCAATYATQPFLSSPINLWSLIVRCLSICRAYWSTGIRGELSGSAGYTSLKKDIWAGINHFYVDSGPLSPFVGFLWGFLPQLSPTDHLSRSSFLFIFWCQGSNSGPFPC